MYHQTNVLHRDDDDDGDDGGGMVSTEIRFDVRLLSRSPVIMRTWRQSQVTTDQSAINQRETPS